MKIGDLDLSNRLILAPMSEISDSSFRKISKEFGAGLTFTQMVSAEGVVKDNFNTLKLLAFNRSEKPIGVQILGNDPEIISDSVREIIKLHPDVIDLNCGCPVSKVARCDFGAMILEKPTLLGKIITSMVDAAGNVPVSVKLRLGLTKNHINILETSRIAEDSGAAFVTIHARTKDMSYNEKPEWEWIKKVKENVTIPVVGNGSVFSAEDAVAMKSFTGCDSVMVARGALGNPFIFESYNSLIDYKKSLPNPDVDKITMTALKHVEYLLREFGDYLGMDRAKKHLIWYFRKFKGIGIFVEKIMSIYDKSLLNDFVLQHSEKIKRDF